MRFHPEELGQAVEVDPCEPHEVQHGQVGGVALASWQPPVPTEVE